MLIKSIYYLGSLLHWNMYLKRLSYWKKVSLKSKLKTSFMRVTGFYVRFAAYGTSPLVLVTRTCESHLSLALDIIIKADS